MGGTGRRRIVVAVGAAAAVAGGVAFVTVDRSQPAAEDPRAGSVEVDEREVLAIGDPPGSYRITYRLETGAGSELIRSTDVVAVRRPFGSRLDAWNGTGTDGPPDSVQVASFGRLRFQASAGAAPLVVARPPAPGASDARLDVTLPAAVDAGLVEVRERRQVVGRDCQVHRSLAPLTSGPLQPATADERTDTCVDAEGLVLEEVYVVSDEQVLRRVATEVEVDLDLEPALFEVPEPTIPVDDGGGSVLPVDPDSRPLGAFHDLASPPAGFTRRGRYAVVPPQADAFADPARRGSIVASTADVFVDGIDLIVVDQGAALENGATFTPTADTDVVAVPGLGDLEVVVSASVLELRTALPDGRFVRVLGTVELDVLVDVAEELRLSEGDGLVYLEDDEDDEG